MLFTQSWVLQLLWVISGMSWALNQQSLCAYLQRLVAFFCIGVACNWCATMLAGLDWLSNFQDVVFQMWFVVGLIVNVAATASLKAQLRPDRTPARARDLGLLADENGARAAAGPASESTSGTTGTLRVRWFVAVCVVCLSGQMVLALAMQPGGTWWRRFGEGIFGSGGVFWGDGLDDKTFTGFATTAFILIAIAHAGPLFLRAPVSAWLPWALLSYIYIWGAVFVPLMFGHCHLERCFLGVELFVVGLVATRVGMKGVAYLRRALHRWWFLFAISLGLLWDPTWDVRFDEKPPSDLLTVLRVKMSEAMCVIGFLCAGELLFDATTFAMPQHAWLRDYGLLLFLTHKAVHILVPHPFNWFCLLLLAFFCWLRLRRRA